MHNKKLSKFLAVSLLAAFGIVGCDDIESRPNDKGTSDSTQVLAFKNIDVFGNNFESMNDSYHSSLASETLDEILYTYAIGIAAPYNATIANEYAKKIQINGKDVKGSDFITLKDVVDGTKSVADFVKQYKAYEVLKEDGSHDTEKEKEYIEARYAAMNKAIARAMYNKMSSYVDSETNKFNEKEMLAALHVGGYKVENPYSLTTGYTKDQLLLPEVEPENVFDAQKGYLHLSFYSSDKNTYIEDEILPSIYNDILTQQYIFDKQESLLGSSYARKINYVAIAYDGLENSIYAEKLVKGFVSKYLLTSSCTDVLSAFKLLSRVWNGEFMKDNNPACAEWTLLKDLGLVGAAFAENDYVGKAGDKYFIKDSAYGDLVEDYDKYDDNPAKSTSTTDYTAEKKYVKEYGFELASDKIKLNDHTTTGWFIKSSSEISGLPDTIKNRLYNLSVASGINNQTASTLSVNEGVWSDTDSNKYVAKFGNNYFLRQSDRKVNEEAYQDIIFNDSSSHTYYIISVEEAISPNYMKTCNDFETKIAVAELLSSSDTNASLAKKYWVEKCDIEYHDQSVYDYFESQFPELFEDD